MRQTSPARPSNERGFTLVEVMIAMVILAVGLLTLAQMMVVATRANALSGHLTAAAALAKEQMELLRAVPYYSDPGTQAISPRLQPGGDLDADVGSGGVNYFQYYDADGRPLADAQGAQFVARWRIETVTGGAGVLPMLRITVRCQPAASEGNPYQFVGDAVYVTYRAANVVLNP